MAEAKRDSRGRVIAGGGSLNPGGRTPDEVRAARTLAEALRKPELLKVGIDAYEALLRERSPAIVKDFMDRVGAKAADRIELSQATSVDGKTEEGLRGGWRGSQWQSHADCRVPARRRAE